MLEVTWQYFSFTLYVNENYIKKHGFIKYSVKIQQHIHHKLVN